MKASAKLPPPTVTTGAITSLIFGINWERPPATSTAPPASGQYLPESNPQAANYGQADTAHSGFGNALIESAQPLQGSFSAKLALAGSGGSLNAPNERVNCQIQSSKIVVGGTALTTQQQLVGKQFYFTLRYAFDGSNPYTNAIIIGQLHWTQPTSNAVPPNVAIRHYSATQIAYMVNAGNAPATTGPVFEYRSDPTNVANNNLPVAYPRPSSMGAMAAFPDAHDLICGVLHNDHNAAHNGNSAVLTAWYRPWSHLTGPGSWTQTVNTVTDAGWTSFATLVTDLSGGYGAGYSGWQIVLPSAYRHVVSGQANNYYFDLVSIHQTLSSAMAYMG